MGWTSDFLTGLAQYLADSQVGVWRPTGPPYGPAETGIVIAAMPPAPDRVVCLTDYPVEDHISEADVTVGVQIRTRGTTDPRDVADLADAIYDLLHGATGMVLGGVSVVQVYRQSYTRLGRDEADRFERSDNYYVDAMRPTAYRPF